MNQRFLLFCLGRTGSTNLALTLNMHPQIRCMMEPFNPTGPYESQFSSRVEGEASLRDCMEEIHVQHNGIKHVWDPHGWPFEGHPGLNRYLATLPDQKVVFLVRKNILKRIISKHISFQTNLWRFDDSKDRARLKTFPLDALDVEEIQYGLKVEKAAIQAYTELFANLGSNVMFLYYEDLFPEGNQNAKNALATVLRVIEFLGFSPPNAFTRLRMLRHLTPKSRMNSVETYSTIPNIREVEAEAGSERTGWLFDDHGSLARTSGKQLAPRDILNRENAFLLFSLARTGSTSLTRALNAHPEIDCVVEPFNPANFESRYANQVTDEASLSRIVEGLYRSHNGIKHVWDPNGWPFHECHLNRSLAATRSQKLVILSRRNILKRLVSFQISEQWQIWHVGESRRGPQTSTLPIQPLDMDRLRKELEWERRGMETYDELRSVNPSSTLSVWYEDIFPEEDESGETGLEEICRIVEFLGFHTPQPEIRRRMLRFMARDKRMNSLESYLRIPNVEEIEALLGSNETGWLLKGSPAVPR